MTLGVAPALSILIAAYNEEASIEACLREVAAVFPDDVEVVVIVGGHDRTDVLVRAMQRKMPGLRYVRNLPDLGKGHAIRRGVREARGELMAQLDADLQFLPSDLPRLLEPLQSGAADVVLGSRFAKGAHRLPGGTPLMRSLGNHLMSAYASALCGQRMTDVLAGIKAWTRSAIDRIDLRSDGYSYEVEIPMRAIRRGLRVVEVPVTTQARHGGESNVDVMRVGPRMLFDISRFRLEES
jgi:glycosyltransferase involved in cell wall biosynthesis